MNFNQSEVNKVFADGTLLYTGVKKVKISVKITNSADHTKVISVRCNENLLQLKNLILKWAPLHGCLLMRRWISFSAVVYVSFAY